VIDHEGDDVGSPGVAPAVQPVASGDYNSDGLINAADYVAWRKLQSQFGGEPGYQAWKQRFGQPSPAAGASVPEPSAAILLLIGIATGWLHLATPYPRKVTPRQSSPALRLPLRPAAR
jgi:hypothetical protein